jgi:hypothetical protein
MTGLTALDTIKKMVTTVAPLLGNVLGSPLSGLGVNLLSNIFHIDDNDHQKLLDAINNDPEAMLKIKTLEYHHEEMLKEIILNEYKTEVEDRISARNRQTSLQDYVPTILAVGFLINYALIQFYVITHNNSANDIISARFQDVLIMIISYYFGSSHKNVK